MNRYRIALVRLNIAVLLLAGARASATDTPAIRRLKAGHYQTKAQKAYEAKDYPEAIRYYNLLLKLEPFSGGDYYNLACSCSLAGDTDAAIDALRHAVDLGWDDREWMEKKDTDLAPLRGDPRFETLCKAAAAAADESAHVYIPETIDDKKPAPVWVALHGFGGNARQFASYFQELADANHMILIAPRGVTKLGQMAYGWNKPGNPRDLDFSAAASLITDTIERVAASHPVDRKRIVLSGFSQGATTALYLAVSDPGRYAGVFAVAASTAMIDTDRLTQAKSDHKPALFLFSGQLDPLHGQVEHFQKAATDAGFRITVVEPEGIGHEMPPDYPAQEKAALRFIFSR